MLVIWGYKLVLKDKIFSFGVNSKTTDLPLLPLDQKKNFFLSRNATENYFFFNLKKPLV